MSYRGWATRRWDKLAAVAAAAIASTCGGGEQAGRTDGGSLPTTVTATDGIDLDAGGTAADGDDDGDETSGKLDLPTGDTMGNGGDCPGGGGMTDDGYEFSNIWIANTPEGTVSKIDTKTGVEVGRYRTGASTDSDPSRTSVNLLGDVAVVNRAGGSVIKIAAREERCVDKDGDGTIRTSTGPADVLDWGQDECVLWETILYTGARAAAWDSGSDPEDAQDGCVAADPLLWVSALDEAGTVHVWRLDGNTGATLDEALSPGWTGGWGGIYGGAVNRERDFFGVGKDNTVLVHVSAQTMAVSVFDAPGVERFYGLAVDADGYPWIASEFDDKLFRFDIVTQQFIDKGATGHGSLRGLAIDDDGDAWIAANNPCDLVHHDVQTGAFTNVGLADCGTPVGVSIDAEGYVWVVDQGSNRAYKVDRVSRTVVATVLGLVAPYTYSDMTGAGLGLVSNPPPS